MLGPYSCFRLTSSEASEVQARPGDCAVVNSARASALPDKGRYSPGFWCIRRAWRIAPRIESENVQWKFRWKTYRERAMNVKISIAVQAVLVAVLSGASFGASAQNSSGATLPASIPTVSTANIAREGFFYVGGHYVGEPGKEVMDGAMYVEVRVPRRIQHPYPIVFIPGGGQTGVDFLQTPDGRPSWAYYFLEQGYVVYIEETVARGRSAYVPGVDGTLSSNRDILGLEKLTDSTELGDWPQAKKYSQWPGKGSMGEPVFDAFAKTQMSNANAGAHVAKLNQEAGAALLDLIGPAILVTHSVGGTWGWLMADARPKLVKAIVNVEPNGPPIRGA